MSTLSDVIAPINTWLNVHQASGLSAGMQVIVQNKTVSQLLLYVGTAAPPDTSGMLIDGNDLNIYTVTPGKYEYLFTRSVGKVVGILGVQQ